MDRGAALSVWAARRYCRQSAADAHAPDDAPGRRDGRFGQLLLLRGRVRLAFRVPTAAGQRHDRDVDRLAVRGRFAGALQILLLIGVPAVAGGHARQRGSEMQRPAAMGRFLWERGVRLRGERCRHVFSSARRRPGATCEMVGQLSAWRQAPGTASVQKVEKETFSDSLAATQSRSLFRQCSEVTQVAASPT